MAVDLEVWAHDGVSWRPVEDDVAPPTDWVVAITSSSVDEFHWTVDFRGLHATATVASLELAVDQMKWSMKAIASHFHVEPPAFGP